MQSPQQDIAEIKSAAALVQDCSDDLTRRIDHECGFTQQFTTNLTLSDDRTHKLYVCGVFTISAGRITKLEESFDLCVAQIGQASGRRRRSDERDGRF